MSTSGNFRQTRSRTAVSVAPSTAGSNSGSDANSRHAGGRDDSRKTRGPRSLDIYGSKESDRAAAQQRRQETLQNVGSAFGRAFDTQQAMPSGVPNPNDQFRQLEPAGVIATPRYVHDTTSGHAHDTTGNDPANHDLDGATAHHTPANINNSAPRQKPRHTGWLSYLATIIGLALPMLACMAIIIKYGSDIVQGQKSIAQQIDHNDNDVRQRLERYDERLINHQHQLDFLSQEIINLHNDKGTGERSSVDWFDPRNMAVTILKYTSPERMRSVGGWLGFFTKQVPFSAAPEIVGPFANVEKMWCAPTDRGKAQVTVLLAQKIFPTKLIVEQADTMDTSPFWQTFPSQIEVWASFDPGVDPNITHWPTGLEGHVSQGRKLAPAQALPSSFKMLGRWKYDVASRQRKQGFSIYVNKPTKLVSVRVNSNHGDSDQTCLHKLRLFGNPTEPQPGVSDTIYVED